MQARSFVMHLKSNDATPVQDYDVGDQPFEREMCVDDVTEAAPVRDYGNVGT